MGASPSGVRIPPSPPSQRAQLIPHGNHPTGSPNKGYSGVEVSLGVSGEASPTQDAKPLRSEGPRAWIFWAFIVRSWPRELGQPVGRDFCPRLRGHQGLSWVAAIARHDLAAAAHPGCGHLGHRSHRLRHALLVGARDEQARLCDLQRHRGSLCFAHGQVVNPGGQSVLHRISSRTISPPISAWPRSPCASGIFQSSSSRKLAGDFRFETGSARSASKSNWLKTPFGKHPSRSPRIGSSRTNVHLQHLSAANQLRWLLY